MAQSCLADVQKRKRKTVKAHERFKGNVYCFVLSRQTELFHVLVFHFGCFKGAYLVFMLSAKKKKKKVGGGGGGRKKTRREEE